MFYFNTNSNTESKISLINNKFYEQHKDMMNKIEFKQKYFIDFTKSNNQFQDSQEIELMKLESPQETKEFIDFL